MSQKNLRPDISLMKNAGCTEDIHPIKFIHSWGPLTPVGSVGSLVTACWDRLKILPRVSPLIVSWRIS